jgi:hypothetical protein
MTGEKLEKAFADCAATIQERYRREKLLTKGQRVKLRPETKAYIGPTRVLAGWVVGHEMPEEGPVSIVHVKPEVQHAPDAHAIRCRLTDLILEEGHDLGVERWQEKVGEFAHDYWSMLRHALWLCEEGTVLVCGADPLGEQAVVDALTMLGFVQGVMWVTLGISLEEIERLSFTNEDPKN